MTATVAEAERIADALPTYKGTSQMTLQYRFWPATLRAKPLIDAGRLGQVTHFRGAYLHAGSVDRDKPLNWKADATQGGGAPGVVEASKIATGSEDELRFEIHGDNGAIRFNLMDPNWLDFCDQPDADSPLGGERGWKRIAAVSRYDKPAGFPSPKNAIDWMRGHMHCLYNFLDAIAKGEPGQPNLATGVELQRLLGKIADMV